MTSSPVTSTWMPPGCVPRPLVHLEEALHLVDDPVEVPGLVAGRRLVGVAVHRVALPDDLVPGGGDLLHDGRQHVADLVVAHPADQRQPARLAARVQALDVLDGLLRRRRRADLESDRVGQQLRERDVRAVELAGALADPEHVRGQVVELRGVAVGALQVQAQQRALVVQQQRLVAGVELDAVQVVVPHPAGVHEPHRAVDLRRDRLVPHARPRTCARSPCSSRAPSSGRPGRPRSAPRTRFIAALALA